MFKITPIFFVGLILIPQAFALEDPMKKNLELDTTSKNHHLVAGWNPTENKKGSKSQASSKTIIALKKFEQMPELEPYFRKAEGFAVFPNIAKAGMGIGGARGKGEVFQNGNVIGSTTVTQISIGFQLGGQAFSQIIFFKQKRDLDRFTQGNFEFGASASAALINAGAATEAAYSNGVAVLTVSKGGLMYEASIGGQKFNFEAYN
tara:strand:+ start:21743 stop:22357 length:615 start_codon:yes stop_codon:yes gene_type:complete